MELKAKAWEKYSKATFMDKIIHQLPAVTATVAQAVASTENITIVSNNGNGTGGANKLAREVTDALATMPAAVEAVAVSTFAHARPKYLHACRSDSRSLSRKQTLTTVCLRANQGKEMGALLKEYLAP